MCWIAQTASERAHWPGLCGGWAHLLCPCRLSVCHVCCVQVPFLCTEAFNAASVTCIMLITELTLSICQVFFNLFLCVCRFCFFVFWTAYLRNVDSDLKCLDSMIYLFLFYFIIIFFFLKAWVCPLNHRLWILQHSLDCFHPLLRAGWKRSQHKIGFVKKKRLSGQKCVLLKDKKKSIWSLLLLLLLLVRGQIMRCFSRTSRSIGINRQLTLDWPGFLPAGSSQTYIFHVNCYFASKSWSAAGIFSYWNLHRNATGAAQKLQAPE